MYSDYTVDIDKILELWGKNTYPIALYINSPFCASECSYCVYRGSGCNREEYNYYYNTYLPKLYDKYKSIIDRSGVQSIYFGGGTCNIYGKLQHFQPIFDKIKHIKCNEKIIELHMGFEITDDQIELLSKNDFTTIILCQQSFNKEILQNKNRLVKYNNNLDNIINKIHEKGMLVGMDLMIYPDLENFELDIENSLQVLSNLKNLPDEITFAVDYLNKDLVNLDNLVKLFSNNQFLNNNYIKWGSPKITSGDFKVNCLRFFTAQGLNKYYQNKFYSFLDCLAEGAFNSSKKSVLGIGSYKNKDKWVYSNIGHNVSYYEINNDLKKDPVYYINYNISTWTYLKQFAEYMENHPMEDLEPNSYLVIGSPHMNISYGNSEETYYRSNNNSKPFIPMDIQNCSYEYSQKFNNSYNCFIKNKVEYLKNNV